MELNGLLNQKQRVMIADRSALFRRGLRALLAADPGTEVVSEAASESELLTRIGSNRIDLLVANSDDFPWRTDFAGRVQEQCPRLALLLLTSEHESGPESGNGAANDCENGLDTYETAGAWRMPRNSTPAELLSKIREISAPEQEAAAVRQASDLQALSEASPASSKPGILTQRERQVIGLLSRGLTVREAALELKLSTKTVEAHTLNLMRKLSLHDRASVIEYAGAHGMSKLPVPA